MTVRCLSFLNFGPVFVLNNIKLSPSPRLSQRSTASSLRSRCRSVRRATCLPATTWSTSRCSPLRTNQRCSAVRTSSSAHSQCAATPSYFPLCPPPLHPPTPPSPPPVASETCTVQRGRDRPRPLRAVTPSLPLTAPPSFVLLSHHPALLPSTPPDCPRARLKMYPSIRRSSSPQQDSRQQAFHNMLNFISVDALTHKCLNLWTG